MLTLFRKAKVDIPEFTTNLPLDDIPNDIHEIMKLVQLTKQDIQYLSLIDDVMEKHANIIAERHYNMIMDIPEIKGIFNEYTTYERYISAITNYYKQLTKPNLGKQYIEYRKKIGLIHSKIQLTEDWYIGSYMRVYEYLVPHIVAKLASKPTELAHVLVALNRIITFDTIIVLKAYKEANEYNLIENLSDAMDEVMNIDEIGELIAIVDQTSSEANEVNESTQQLNVAVEQVAVTASNASNRTKEMVEQANKSKEVVETSLTGFLEMINEFQQSKDNFETLTEKVDSISEVTDFIKSIADETNLLALNASIEAARAGEQGLGFAVVADEVRKLAEQTKTSVENITKEILEVQQESSKVSESIIDFSEKLSEHVDQTNFAMKSIEQIMEHIAEVNQAIGAIAAFTEGGAEATEEISAKMSNLQKHFEKTKQMTFETGKALYTAGKGVNEIRKNALKAIKSPNEEQQKRIQETEERVAKWLEYNDVSGFGD